jgi:hypothetical protein
MVCEINKSFVKGAVNRYFFVNKTASPGPPIQVYSNFVEVFKFEMSKKNSRESKI